MPGAGFGRQFAKGGSAFYCGRVFTARHMSSVSSPLIRGYVAPTAFLAMPGLATATGCTAPTAASVMDALGVTSADSLPALPRTALTAAGQSVAVMNAAVACTFLREIDMVLGHNLSIILVKPRHASTAF